MPAVGVWHTYEIEAIGPNIAVRLDGQQVSQFKNANRRMTGYIGLQNHHPGSKVQFTRLRIRKLTAAAPAARLARSRATTVAGGQPARRNAIVSA